VGLAEDTGQHALLAQALAALAAAAAGLGHEEDCRRHCARGLEMVGGDATAVYLYSALGLLEHGLGRMPEAIEAIEQADRIGLRLDVSEAVVPRAGDLIEAYVRAGRREEAEAVLARLEADAQAGPRWPRAAAARCTALLAPDDGFRAAFDRALALHEQLPMPFERARTLLAFGERLRRAKQRADAREPLTAALDAFERLGARPWAERARAELRATGGQAGGRRAQAAAEQLTPHELQIALLVAQGMTNREAAAALFLSPKTIEYHLGQIYRKLDVRGRAQLARLMAMELPEGERDPAALAAALS
jgi:DNA-binding CsgD family transcriptional regulator